MQKVSALIAGVLGSVLIVAPAGAGSVSLDPAGGTEAAVAAVEGAVARFETVFAGRAGCMGAGTVVFESLADRKGEYRTAEAVIVVNPDREVSTMAATVYHELAHHTMISCRAHRDPELAAAFYAAQDLPVDRSWFDGGSGWSGTPAEHFAEAAVMLVQGSTDGRIPVSAGAVDVLRRWVNGEPMPVIVAEPETSEATPVGVAQTQQSEAVATDESSAPALTNDSASVSIEQPSAEQVSAGAPQSPPDEPDAGETFDILRCIRVGWLQPV